MRIISKLILLLTSLAITAPVYADDYFLSESTRNLIENSDGVVVTNYGVMQFYPERINSVGLKTGSRASAQEFEQIKTMLINATTVDKTKRLSECYFKPGFALTFFKETLKNNIKEALQPPLQILLCFNCDVWAIAQSLEGLGIEPPTKEQVILFGDLRPNTEKLKKLEILK